MDLLVVTLQLSFCSECEINKTQNVVLNINIVFSVRV